MEKKELKKYNIVDSVYFELFGLKGTHEHDFNFDVIGNGNDIDLTKTSGDLDIHVTTMQTRSENVYFYIELYDYRKREEIKAGYFYIKNNHGLIGIEELKALNLIIQAANKRIEQIFEAIG